MVKLIWSPRAVEDLDAACAFIARDSDKYAYLFAERIIALIEAMPANPLAGAIVPEYDRADLRERLFQNYRIVYRMHKDAVEIVAIVHGARLLPPLLPD